MKNNPCLIPKNRVHVLYFIKFKMKCLLTSWLIVAYSDIVLMYSFADLMIIPAKNAKLIALCAAKQQNKDEFD